MSIKKQTLSASALTWLPPVDWSSTKTVTPRSTLDRVAKGSSAESRQLTLAADGSILRVTYGRDRIGADVANNLDHNGYWVIQCVWGEGEIDAIESIQIGDKDLPAGTQVAHYLGTQGQTANSWLVSAFAKRGISYSDAHLGVAYSVLRVPAAELKDTPQITAIIRGRKLYDPRTGLTAYSSNPALALADLLRNPIYGGGRELDESSVAAVATICDEVLSGSKRREIGLTLAGQDDLYSVADTLRTYAGCWIVQGESGLKLIPDRPSATVKSFSHDDGSILKLGPLRKAAVSDAPTVVTVTYTDTTQQPWVEARVSVYASGVQQGTTPRRESVVPLPGIQSKSQAVREATERLNKLTLFDLSCDLETFDESIALEEGDVVTVTHPVGLTNKPFRVMGKSGEYGRYRLSLVEYDPAAYSDAVVFEPSSPDTSLPPPGSPLPPTDLSISEELVQLVDGTWTSRIRASWAAPDWPYVSGYRVIVRSAGVPWSSGVVLEAGPLEWATPPVKEKQSYTVEVSTLSRLGAVSEVIAGSIVPLGKFLPPSDIPSLSVTEVNRVLHLAWEPAIDIDIWRYEIRRGIVGGTWEAATFIDRVDGLRAQIGNPVVGAATYYVKAIDSVGNYSVNATSFVYSFEAPAPVPALGGFYASPTIELYWGTSPNAKNYEVRKGTPGVTWAAATPVQTLDGLGLSLSGYALGSYDFLVKSIDAIGNYSDNAARTTVVVAAPAVVTGFTGFEVSGESRLSWNANTGTGVKNYEVRYGAVGAAWASAKVIDRTDALRLNTKSVPVGEWDFMAKAISHEGFYSATEARYKMSVTLDANAFLVDEYEYDNPTVAGMAEFALGREDASRYFVTEDGVVMSTKFPAATMSSYGNVMSTYNTVASAWTSETESFGISLTGSWRAVVPITDIQGTHTETLELSNDDGVSWSQYPFTAKTTARAARVKVNAASGSSILVTIPEATIRVDATPREESGTVTSLASGGALVQLANEYTSAMTLGVTPIGSAPRTAVFDQLLLAPVDGLVVEAMGVVSAGTGATYYTLPGSRVVQAGDHVEYDVFVVSQPPTVSTRSGGLGMFFNGDWNHYFYDSYGSNWDSASIPTGQWVSRKFDLTAKAGMTVNGYRLMLCANEQTVAAPAKAVYRNIRVTDGNGNTRLTIWNNTDPAFSTYSLLQNMTSPQAGLANTFRVYVFDQNNTQIVNPVMWNFKGV